MKIILRMGDRKFPTILGVAIVVIAPLLIPDLLTKQQSEEIVQYIVQFIGVMLTAFGKSILKD